MKLLPIVYYDSRLQLGLLIFHHIYYNSFWVCQCRHHMVSNMRDRVVDSTMKTLNIKCSKYPLTHTSTSPELFFWPGENLLWTSPGWGGLWVCEIPAPEAVYPLKTPVCSSSPSSRSRAIGTTTPRHCHMAVSIPGLNYKEHLQSLARFLASSTLRSNLSINKMKHKCQEFKN